MKTIASFFKRLAFSPGETKEQIVANSSNALHVNREDLSGILEIRGLNAEDDNPSNILRVSWIKKDELHAIMKTTWVNSELGVL